MEALAEASGKIAFVGDLRPIFDSTQTARYPSPDPLAPSILSPTADTRIIRIRSPDRWECYFAAFEPMIVRKPFLNLHQTTLDRKNRRFCAGFHAELCQNIADMRFDGEFVGCEDAGDVLVG